MWAGKLKQKIVDRQENHLYRETYSANPTHSSVIIERDGCRLVNFCSNDYLGLRQHPLVKARFQHAADKYGVGSGASHLVCGHSPAHETLQNKLAEFTGRERALVFSTGYMANLGVLTALSDSNTLTYADKLNHASLNDGLLLSGGRFKRYPHQDIDRLAQLLAQNSSDSMIVTDGVFSMDGDIAALSRLSELADIYQSLLIVDDAHGFGVLGEHGKGCAEYFGLKQSQLPVLIGTFGKALGTFGAFVAGSSLVIDNIIQFAKTYTYTTALPPAVAEATCVSLMLLETEAWRRKKLQALIDYFRCEAQRLSLPLLPSKTPIQPLIVGDCQMALTLSQQLYERGFWVSAIRPPTVPPGQSRLRITLSAEHNESDVSLLLNAIADCLKKVRTDG